MLRKEADGIGYADVSDGDRRPEEPTWLNKIADEMEDERSDEGDKDPDTDFTKWLKMNYNKAPRDLTADEYAKMSKEFKEQNKKTEAEVDEADVDEGNEFIDARRQAIKKGEKDRVNLLRGDVRNGISWLKSNATYVCSGCEVK